MPKLSIITICRNAERHLATCLQSVAAQEGVPPGEVEHWLVDGLSTDSTLAVAKKFPHLRVNSQKDAGISDAFNRGVALAQGEWILFLNSDDKLADPTVLRDALGSLDPSFDFVYGKIKIMDERLEQPLHERGANEAWRFLHRRMTIPHPALFAKKDTFQRFGLFDLSFRIAMDYEWLLRSYASARFQFLPRTITLFRSGGASTGNQWLRQALECYRAKNKNSVGSPILRLAWLFYQSFRFFLQAHAGRVPGLGPAHARLAALVRKGF